MHIDLETQNTFEPEARQFAQNSDFVGGWVTGLRDFLSPEGCLSGLGCGLAGRRTSWVATARTRRLGYGQDRSRTRFRRL